jgi:hypothetical protein
MSAIAMPANSRLGFACAKRGHLVSFVETGAPFFLTGRL